MDIIIKINCDNAAFENLNEEVARILRKLADGVDYGNEISRSTVKRIMDSNGNRVGQLEALE